MSDSKGILRCSVRFLSGLLKKKQRWRLIRPFPIPQSYGFLIVQEPEAVMDWFEKFPSIIKHEKEYKSFRMVFSELDVRRYRGISRNVLDSPMPFLRFDDLEHYMNEQREENKAALKKWWELMIEQAGVAANTKLPKSEWREEYEADGDLFPTIESALTVYELLEHPERYEIIGVKKEYWERNPKTLGFDIGSWSGNHFSLIADTLVTPLWHPAPEADYQELRLRLSILNPNILFDSPEDASDFRNWYRSKDWAETENYECPFRIIQVDRAP